MFKLNPFKSQAYYMQGLEIKLVELWGHWWALAIKGLTKLHSLILKSSFGKMVVLVVLGLSILTLQYHCPIPFALHFLAYTSLVSVMFRMKL